MKPTSIITAGLIAIGLLAPIPAQAQYQKLAQTGMKFLAVGQSARQSGLADAFSAVEGQAASMFYNPAGLARLDGLADVCGGQTQWIGDIRHLYAGVALSPWNGDWGVIGIQAQYVDYGEIQQSIRVNSTDGPGYMDLGTFRPFAYMYGLTYARALSNKFSIGGSVKMVTQDLGTSVIEVDSAYNPSKKVKTSLVVVAFDFGILYKTGFKSLNFGMTVRNFARQVSYVKDPFQLPLLFRIGLSMNVFDLAGVDPADQSLLIAVDAEHPRDYPEQVRVGIEYTFARTISFRAGYVGPADEQSFSYGVGLQQRFMDAGFSIDYSYTPFGVFTSVHRWSLGFLF